MAGKTELHVFRKGWLTSVHYRDEILDVHIRPCGGAFGDNFIFVDDKTLPPRTRVVKDYLRHATIERMDWPTRSSGPNPT